MIAPRIRTPVSFLALRLPRLLLGLLAVTPLVAGRGTAQSFRRAGSEFEAARQVIVPLEKGYTIVVVEFFHHGQIRPDGQNVVVAAESGARSGALLQLGPGDFCRLAFETIKGQRSTTFFTAAGPPHEPPPPWSCRDGLLLETRRFRTCGFWSRESVRRAFDTAEPIGADYVNGVFHGCNPFSLRREPFLSRYTGLLDLKKRGTYGLITSSQDCSFLSIDGKLGGRRPGLPWPDVPRPGRAAGTTFNSRPARTVSSTTTPPAALMPSWWRPGKSIQQDQRTDKSRPIIPSDVFHAYAVGHLPVGPAALRTTRNVPDYTIAIEGEVPLPDNDIPLIGVRFYDCSPKPLVMQGSADPMGFRRRAIERAAQSRACLFAAGPVHGRALDPAWRQAGRDRQPHLRRSPVAGGG